MTRAFAWHCSIPRFPGEPFAIRPARATVKGMWHLAGGRTLDLSARGVVMGILNVTPDSFSDGGSFLNRHRAVDHAVTMLDVAASSTR